MGEPLNNSSRELDNMPDKPLYDVVKNRFDTSTEAGKILQAQQDALNKRLNNPNYVVDSGYHDEGEGEQE